MVDDTTSSPDPNSPDLNSPEPNSPTPSTPEPADQALEPANGTHAEVVEQIAGHPDEQPIGQAVDDSDQQAAEASVHQPVPNPVTAPPEPSVATTFVVEPTSASLASQTIPSADEEGGEWELLLQKLRQWLHQGELQSLWSQGRRPLTLLAALVGLLLVLRVYSAILGALDSLPLVPGLLELAGVVWTVRYGVPKLLRSSERDRLLSGLSTRWNAFLGKG